jgi:hypothetical protein
MKYKIKTKDGGTFYLSELNAVRRLSDGRWYAYLGANAPVELDPALISERRVDAAIKHASVLYDITNVGAVLIDDHELPNTAIEPAPGSEAAMAEGKSAGEFAIKAPK